MGFNVSYVVDILKFPWPLFPRYKKLFPVGFRFDIPAFYRDFNWDINLPGANKYELQSIAFSSTGYKDGDNFSIICNNEYIVHRIYTKELGQEIPIRPVRRIDSGDNLRIVFHNDTGTSKVVWFDLILAAQNAVSVGAAVSHGVPEVSPLAYFVALGGQEGYVNPDSISTAYWNPGLVVSGIAIPSEFWRGRNQLLAIYGNNESMITIPASHYRRYLYKLVDMSKQGFVTPLLSSRKWEEFKIDSKKIWGQGGLGLGMLNDKQLGEIYLSHMLKVPVTINDDSLLLLEGNRVDFILSFLKLSHTFTLDWVDFADVEDDPSVVGSAYDPAGLSVDPVVFAPVATVKSYINIEPTSFNLSHEYSITANPREFYFPPGATSWLDARFRAMDGEADPQEFYHLSGTDPTINVAEIFNHEMGHALDFYRRDRFGELFSQLPEWLSISGWELNYYDLYTYGNGPLLRVDDYLSNLGGVIEPPVSPYGAFHPCEDFAETYAMWRCNPRALQNLYPKRWMFFENKVKSFGA